METTSEAEIELQIYQEVYRLFAGVDDPAHDWLHVSRVYSLARNIAEQEEADRFIVGVAALLHDLGRLPSEMPYLYTNESDRIDADSQGIPTENWSVGRKELPKHHAETSAILAMELLAPYPIATERKQAILHAVVAHSYSGGIEPDSLEAWVVRDADRLDGLGAIGIMRWAITGTMRRTSQTQSYDPDDPFDERHTPDDKKYMLDHFYAKLLKLAGDMRTETGRRMEKERSAFMQSYLEEFRRELGE